MGSHASLDEAVLFELPSRRFAERLLAHLTPKRLAWLETNDAGLVVGILLNSDPRDLAVLLRSVQEWMERWGLAVLRFEVDGRVYALEARRPRVAPA